MSLFTRIGATFRSLFRKEELDRDLDEELRSYLDLLTDQKIEAGMDPGEARRAARLELGGVEQVKERVREIRLGSTIETLAQDIRYGVRILRRDAGFAFAAILILAIGIGANTALFSTINTVLLRQIPFEAPDRLVTGLKTNNGEENGSVSRVDYFDYRELGRSFEHLAAIADSTPQHTVTGGSSPELVRTGYVTWNLFRTLGANPVVGRHFTPEEENPGQSNVAMISFGLWQRRFGGSGEVVGKSLNLDGSPLTIVGVMPRAFHFLFDADLWRLVDREGPFDTRRGSHSHLVVGRLKAGVSIEQAQSEVDAISFTLGNQYPESNRDKGLVLGDLHGFMVGEMRLPLLLLMATTILVLVIACGNVAGLLLARGLRRSPEMAMRSALGASRLRLVRQLLTESMLLTGAAGLAGIAVAHLLLDLLLQLLPISRLGIGRPAIDTAALLFTLIVSVVTGLIAGVIPALRNTYVDPARQLRAGTRASEPAAGTRLRNNLVVLQVAFTVVLLICSGLLIRSLVELATVDLGFDPHNLLIGEIRIQPDEYPSPDERNRFFASLLEEVEALPGVSSASMINKLPIVSPWQNWGARPADQPPPSGPDGFSAMARWVHPGYFQTMRIPLLKGRDVSATDVAGNPRVMVVSEAMAAALFPGLNPIGRSVIIGRDGPPHEVIGIAGDARVNTLRREPDPTMYMASAQIGDTRMQIAVRTAGNPSLLVAPIRQMLRRNDPNVLFADAATMSSIIDDALADFRIEVLSLGMFSGVALLLSAIGLYGLLSYHVSRQANEIGIRLALGASNINVFGMILKKGLSLIGIGLAVGVAVAYSGSLLIRQLLFEIQPLDPATYFSAATFLGFAAALACFLPAWRATRINPVEVLRRE